MFRPRLIAACLSGLAAAALLAPALPAAADAPGPTPAGYLALGDSAPFGYNPYLNSALGASQYVGYPESTASTLRLPVANASCPCGSTGGFMDRTSTDDNGCQTQWRPSGGPMHVAYAGSQLDYAVAYLSSHPQTRLVTLNIGANDVFHCQKIYADKCASEFPATLTTIGMNLHAIFTRLRSVYSGPLVTVTYYSTDYSNAALTGSVQALNQVLTGQTVAAGGVVANGFASFGVLASLRNGSTCAARLLIPNPAGGCDEHPSAFGHAVLTAAVDGALLRALASAASPVSP